MNDLVKENGYEEAIHTHQRIKVNSEIAAKALVEVCRDLKKMRDEKLYEELGYDTFDGYCENMAGIKSRMAYNYISALERLGESVLQSNAELGITKLELIAGMNPDERNKLLDSGDGEFMSVSEIKELVKKSKFQGEQISLLEEQLKEAESADDPEKDKLREKIAELEREIEEANEYDAEEDSAFDRVKELEEQLRQKEKEHAEQLEQAREKAPEQDNSAEIQKQIDSAVAAAKKSAEKEARAKAKEQSDKQAERIKELEAAVTAAGTEKEKLQKQLALSDTDSAKAMVYIQAIQDSFNSLFTVMSAMSPEQQNGFKGAVLKLTDAMRKKAEI